MRAIVVGGGLAGLFTASELAARGIADLELLESGDQVGGVARTRPSQGFELEPGAGSFALPHPYLSSIIERSGVTVLPAQATASTRYLFVHEELAELPSSPKVLLTPALSTRAKLRLLAEPFVAADKAGIDESISSFCRRRFGMEAGRLLAWLMASGVFAGDPETLSMRSAFPMLANLAEHEGSVIAGEIKRRRERDEEEPRASPHYVKGGMQVLADALADAPGLSCRTGFEVESVTRRSGRWLVNGPETLEADVIVLACAPSAAAQILSVDGTARLAEAKAAPVAVVGLGGDNGLIPDGFGALVGPNEGMTSLGVLFESSYAPERAPAGSWLVKVVAGGATRPDVVDLDEESLMALIVDEVGRVLGRAIQPTFRALIRHESGIPQYDIGHSQWLRDVDRIVAANDGLYLTGWGYRGVGISHIAADAARVASQVIRAMG